MNKSLRKYSLPFWPAIRSPPKKPWPRESSARAERKVSRISPGPSSTGPNLRTTTERRSHETELSQRPHSHPPRPAAGRPHHPCRLRSAAHASALERGGRRKGEASRRGGV